VLNLLIDIGNSNIKTALSRGKRIFNYKRIDYSKTKFEESFKKILDYKSNSIDSAGISCLNNKLKLISERIIRNSYSLKPFYVECNKRIPIKLKYEKTLGNDRICSAVAAAVKYADRKNILVVDFGTATTYNLIVKNEFTGGLITPGIMTSLLSLNINANLPMTELRNVRELISGKTKVNIISGIIHQSLFTTEGVINALRKKYHNLFVVSTGGLAELIRNKSVLIDKFDKNLVLEGINIILNYNLKEN
jgi:type III pantothenate kinase